jgi:hypothetical protein
MHIEESLGGEKRQVGARTFVLHQVWCARTGDDRTWVELDIIELLPDGSGLLAVTDHPGGDQMSDETLAALPAIGGHPIGEHPATITADQIAALLSADTTDPDLADPLQAPNPSPACAEPGECPSGCACPPF